MTHKAKDLILTLKFPRELVVRLNRLRAWVDTSAAHSKVLSHSEFIQYALAIIECIADNFKGGSVLIIRDANGKETTIDTLWTP